MKIYKTNESTLEELQYVFSNQSEVIIETNYLTQNDKNYICDFLKICLEEIGKEEMYGYLHYCFIELLENANRANIKRLYFNENNLDIKNENDYKQGMKKFNRDFTGQLDTYSKKLVENNCYVRAHFKVEDDIIFISVKNNSLILDQELLCARERIGRAKQFVSIEDAYAAVTNENNEGAGLGIIITILMLRKIGLNKDALNIFKNDKETISSIMLPLSLITFEKNLLINEVVVKEINDIPQFPKHITKLQEMLNNPDIKINEISKIISNDPSLVADILRFANSSIFMMQGKVSSIPNAIKLIGFKRLKNLLYSYGTKEILKKRYNIEEMEHIWKHSYKVAFFAFHIAKKCLPNINLEDVYIAALLHDIGKTLLLGINPELINKLTFICQTKSIPIRIIEDITSGYNHALIGSTIAKKWNFPEKYIQVIRYHNNPLNCNDKYEEIVYATYLANMMIHNENQYEIYKQIFNSILYYFKIDSFNSYKSWIETLTNKFENKKN